MLVFSLICFSFPGDAKGPRSVVLDKAGAARYNDDKEGAVARRLAPKSYQLKLS